MINYKDNLTGLYNIKYLEKKYKKFCKKNKNCYLIAIDFAKLKTINDCYGHQEGDNCIKVFVEKMKDKFLNDIFVRRSGDEFIILSSLNLTQIEKNLLNVQNEIIEDYKNGKIKYIFSFNCGIKKAGKDFFDEIHKTDITLYEAKYEEKLYLEYDTKINYKISNYENLLSLLDIYIDDNLIDYNCHVLYSNNTETNIYQFIMKNDYLAKFIKENKKLLYTNNYVINKIDRYSTKKIIEYPLSDNVVRKIDIHGKTLINNEKDYIEYLKELINKNNLSYNDICIGINLYGCNKSIDNIIEKIVILKSLGIKICINDFSLSDCSLLLLILCQTNIDYINVDSQYYNSLNDKTIKLFEDFILMMNKYKIKLLTKFYDLDKKYIKDKKY